MLLSTAGRKTDEAGMVLCPWPPGVSCRASQCPSLWTTATNDTVGFGRLSWLGCDAVTLRTTTNAATRNQFKHGGKQQLSRPKCKCHCGRDAMPAIAMLRGMSRPTRIPGFRIPTSYVLRKTRTSNKSLPKKPNSGYGMPCVTSRNSAMERSSVHKWLWLWQSYKLVGGPRHGQV